MKGIKFRYNFINVAVISLSVVLFIIDYRNIGELFQKNGIAKIFIVLATVVIVHAIKAGRLYLALYGSDITFRSYLKVYCKVTPASMIIPYKLGEFFRMYCYGKILDSMIRGIVIIILDRFMDTIALVTMILIIWGGGWIGGGHITFLVYVLLIFLIFILIVYFAFPGVYKFWKHYMLSAEATERKLSILKMLGMLNHVYEEIQGVSKGRGIILYFMSLVAWAVEIVGVILQTGIFSNTYMSGDITNYLSSALGSNTSNELELFVFVSVIAMLVIYFIVKLVDWLTGKKGVNENNSCI